MLRVSDGVGKWALSHSGCTVNCSNYSRGNDHGQQGPFKYTYTLAQQFNFFFIYFLLLERRREKESQKNISVWLPLTCPQLETWPATQACALTGNQTGNPLAHRPVLNPLSHTSQGSNSIFKEFFLQIESNRFAKMFIRVGLAHYCL